MRLCRVKLEIRFDGKIFRRLAGQRRFFRQVSFQVLLEDAKLSEGPRAEPALQPLLSGIDSLVHLKESELAERLSAHAAAQLSRPAVLRLASHR